MPWTAEQAREYAAKGGRARAESMKARKAKTADERAKAIFEAAASTMAAILVEAAKGEGDFAALEPKERAAFAKTVLEFGIGRPMTRKAKEAEEAPEDDHGLELA